MKKQIKFVVCLTAFVLISGVFFTFQTLAQNVKPIAVPSDVWYLNFKVTVTGEGVIHPEDDPEKEIKWKVNREYQGTFTLAAGTFYGIGSGKEAAEEIKNKRFVRFTTADAPKMSVKIDDSIVETSEFETCGEIVKTVVRRYWDGNVTGNPGSKFDTSLSIDNLKRSHNVSIPISLNIIDSVDGKLLEFQHFEEITTTSAKGETSSETNIITKKSLPIFGAKVPKIFGLLENKRIRHKDYMSLKYVNGGYEFTSDQKGESDGYDEVLPSIDTRDKINVHVSYRFTK